MPKIIYWEDEEENIFKAFFGTWFMVIFKPKSFFESVKSSEKILPPLLFGWINMFFGALVLSFIYGPMAGYERPKLSEVGFMIIIIPVIFILPVSFAALLVQWGLTSNHIQSSWRSVFRLFCYSFSSIFLFLQMILPLSRYPFILSQANGLSYYFGCTWILIITIWGVKHIFQISINKALNSSVFFILILFAISSVGFIANNKFISAKINKGIEEKNAFDEKNVAIITNLVKERTKLFREKHGFYPLSLAELVKAEFYDQPSEIRCIVDWQMDINSEAKRMAALLSNAPSDQEPPYGYFYNYKSDGKKFIFKAMPWDITHGEKIFEISE